jgi:peptide/nickel transport system permease protein
VMVRQLARRPGAVVGAVILGFWIACAVAPGVIEPHDPLAQQLLRTNAAPSVAHLFGTDQLGRDVASRVISGARSILEIAPLAAFVGTVLGTVVGLVMGYFGGITDILLGRVLDAVLSLPIIVVAFLFVVAVGPSTAVLVLVIGCVFGPIVARTVRAAVFAEAHLEYVDAARLRGDGTVRILFGEILPNVLPVVVVEFTVRVGYGVFTLASLSFLGFGIQPPTPSWGYDIEQSYGLLAAGYWWETLFPALAIASLVVAITLLSDSIETVLSS